MDSSLRRILAICLALLIGTTACTVMTSPSYAPISRTPAPLPSGGTALSLETAPAATYVPGNWACAESTPASVRVVREGEADAVLNLPFGPLGRLDLFPRHGWASNASEESERPLPFPDWEKDFNGKPRQSGSVGAYSDSGTNPGWLPGLERKPE